MSNTTPFKLNMSSEERHEKLVALSDDDIDYSDIPALDDEFIANAELVKSDQNVPVGSDIDSSFTKDVEAIS